MATVPQLNREYVIKQGEMKITNIFIKNMDAY